jgi:dTDP-4-amino-4,6-dideoxygalactose transaminase
MGQLREQGIATTFHYVPLHDSDGGRRFAARPTECPVSSDVSSRLVRLPFFNTLAPAEVERVADALVAAVEKAT